MNTQKAYYIGTHPDSFRSGEAAVITGVVFAQPPGGIWRPCFEVVYADGKTDFCAITDKGNYIITNEVRPSFSKI